MANKIENTSKGNVFSKQEQKEDADPYLQWLGDVRGLSHTTISHYNSYYKHFVKRDLTQANINAFLQEKK